MHPLASNRRVWQPPAVLIPLPAIRPAACLAACATVFLTFCLGGCLNDGGNGDEAEVWKSVSVADSTSYQQDPFLLALPDSSVLGLWGRIYKGAGKAWAVNTTRLNVQGQVDGLRLEPLAQSVSIQQPVADAIPGGGGATLAWFEWGPGLRDTRIKVWRLASSGSVEPMTLNPPRAANIIGIDVLSLPDQGFVVACAYADSAYASSLWIARFDRLGGRVGDPFQRTLDSDGTVYYLAHPVLVARPGGGWLALWKEYTKDDGAFVLSRRFDAGGTSSDEELRRETGQGCPAGIRVPLHALSFPGGRTLVIPGGDGSCSFLLDGDGKFLRGFARDSANAFFTDQNHVAAVDTGKGLYLSAAGRRLTLLDSNLVEKAARYVPEAYDLIEAAAYTAAGRPAVITQGIDGLRILLLDRFWR